MLRIVTTSAWILLFAVAISDANFGAIKRRSHKGEALIQLQAIRSVFDSVSETSCCLLNESLSFERVSVSGTSFCLWNEPLSLERAPVFGTSLCLFRNELLFDDTPALQPQLYVGVL